MSDIAIEKTYVDFVLPASVVTKVDVSHLVNELERIDSELTTAAVRLKTGGPAQATPVLTQQLNDFLYLNKLTIGESKQRSELTAQVRTLKDTAPVLHMTFAVEADRESLGQLVQWIRASLHPQAVIVVGLQPALVAGVYLRTSNHIYDLSLRTLFKGRREALVADLGVLHGGK